VSKGRFITIEGGEGAGKSTQIRALADWLRQSGLDVLTTREPGGSPGAEAIRKLLVEGAIDRWDAMTEALLHFAARRDHLVRTVWPALERGQWVISDRFADSTMAYQGYGHGLGRAPVEQLGATTMGDFKPDLTVIMDIPVEMGLKRALARHGAQQAAETRYENMDLQFHIRLRQGFIDIALREPRRCRIVDASADIDQVQARIREAVTAVLGVGA
jgi:dTMP kinase